MLIEAIFRKRINQKIFIIFFHDAEIDGNVPDRPSRWGNNA